MSKDIEQNPSDTAEGPKAGEGKVASSASNRTRAAASAEVEEREPQTEQELNVPKMQTIVMLAIISALTLIVWFSARLSCNLHPDQVRTPRHYSLYQLAALPKDAAFEFQQRYEMGDYTAALDLSKGPMRATLEQKFAECEKDPDACEARRSELAGTVEGVAALLDEKDDQATVEVTSISSRTGSKTYTLTVERDGIMWKVTDRREGGRAPVTAPPPAEVPAPAAEGAAPAEPAAPVEAAAPVEKAPAEPAVE